MDPLSALLFSIAVTWWIKHFGQNGHAEYEHTLGRAAEAVAKVHPDWSERRVRRSARRQARAYWWNQAVRGFPDWRGAREADADTMRARWAEEQLNTAMRRREAWRRIREAKAAWDRLHDEERQAREADAAGPEPAAKPASEGADAQDGPEIVDAEIVDDEPAAEGRPSTGGPEPAAPEPAAPPRPAPAPAETPRARPARPSTPAAPVPAPAGSNPAPDPSPSIPAGSTPPAEEGDPMAPRPPGPVVPRNGSAPARRSSTGGGEAWTHGQFEKSTAEVQAHADAVPPKLEQMLGNLHAVDAGRSQVAGVMWGYERLSTFIAEVQRMLAESNRRARPVVQAVDGAGGPGEIANINYYQRV